MVQCWFTGTVTPALCQLQVILLQTVNMTKAVLAHIYWLDFSNTNHASQREFLYRTISKQVAFKDLTQRLPSLARGIIYKCK
jgi:hypothetical protein